MKALIVDDSRFIRQHLRQLLQGMGMNCEEAEDGREAIDLLVKRRVNLIGVVCNGVDQLMKDYYYNKYPEYYAVKHDT